jgi:hypothetical protein
MSYEFTEDQNKIILNLAKFMKIASIITVFTGIIDMINAIIDASIYTGIYALLLITMGITFYFPLDNLTNIVKEEGSDIKELMQAFSEISKGFTIIIIILILLGIIFILDWNIT